MQDFVQVKALTLVEDRAGLAQLTKELMVRPTNLVHSWSSFVEL